MKHKFKNFKREDNFVLFMFNHLYENKKNGKVYVCIEGQLRRVGDRHNGEILYAEKEQEKDFYHLRYQFIS